MNISGLVYIFLLLTSFLGISIFYQNIYRRGREYIRFKTLWKKELISGITKNTKLIQQVNLNSNEGFKMMYSIIRYLVFIICTIYFFTNEKLNFSTLSIIILLFFITNPTKSIYNRRTLYGYIWDTRVDLKKKKIDQDIFYAMTRLKNLCYAQGSNAVSGGYLIELLLKDAEVTYYAFSKLLILWRLGNKQEACAFFSSELDTKMAYEFSNILLKLDDMQPTDMVHRLELYQHHIREERMTEELKLQEVISYILYMPIIASAFFIMLNFLVVVVIMDTMIMLQNI